MAKNIGNPTIFTIEIWKYIQINSEKAKYIQGIFVNTFYFEFIYETKLSSFHKISYKKSTRLVKEEWKIN